MKKFFSFIFGLIFCVIAAVGVAGAGGYMYVLNTYNIDIMKVADIIKTLQQPVDEAELCPNAYSAGDMVDVKDLFDASVEDFITEQTNGGYSINFDDLTSEMEMHTTIKLTDKQVAAVAQEVVVQEIAGMIEFGGKPVEIELKQVDFTVVSEDTTSLNVVLCLDMSSFLVSSGNEMIDAAMSLIPEKWYVSSTVSVLRDVATPFSYEVRHNAFSINNLAAEDTEYFFNVLGSLFEIEPLSTWNEYIGTTIMNSLVGNEESTGLAYGLKNIGATNYAFVTEGGTDYFVIYCTADIS